MSTYQVQTQSFELAGSLWHIRSLLDGNQYSDPEGAAAACGISEEGWSHFGRIWPAGQVLAEVVGRPDAKHRRMLEIGCGLALAGLVAHRALADITVSDLHPLAETFLLHNLALNGLPPLAYRTVDWSRPPLALGRFETLIGSDILYEPQQAAQLADFVLRHATEDAEIIVVDPGRGHRGHFSRLLQAQGFACVITASGRTQVLHYQRP